MGGHGGLNILPQKRWNVYRRDNRLRVRRDEEQHREEQQRQRQQDERQRMSNVLILLRRKKAEAQARRRQRQNAPAEDAKTQLNSCQLSTTNSCSPKDSSQSAWPGTPADLGSGSCSTFTTVSEGVGCLPPSRRAAPCQAVVTNHDADPMWDGTSTSVVRAGQFLAPLSSGAEATAPAAAAGGNSAALVRSASFLPSGSCSSGRGAEHWDEFSEPFLVDHPSVVRVRVPTTACPTAAAVSTESSHAAGFSSAAVDSGIVADDSLQCLSSAISFETGTRCSGRGASVLDQADAAWEAQCASSSAADTWQPQEQQQRAKGQMQHVNFFLAEEKELRKLEMQRKKYLLQAGYTPGARSEFDQEIRTSLTQIPWYYQPPSASSKSKPASSLHTTELCFPALAGRSQHVPQQSLPLDPSKTTLVKHGCAAASAAVVGKKDRGVEEQGQEGGLCKRSQVLGLEPAAPAAIQKDTSLQHVAVHTEERLEKEEKPCILRKTDGGPLLESEQNRRRSGWTKGKDESNRSLRRESRKKTRRIRRDKETAVTRRKGEGSVECLQVMLLVEDDEEISVT